MVRVWFGFVAGSRLFRAYFLCGGLVFGFVFRFVFGSYLVRVFVLVDSRRIWGFDIYLRFFRSKKILIESKKLFFIYNYYFI